MEGNVFTVENGVPILNGTPLKYVLEYGVEAKNDRLIVTLKLDALPLYLKLLPRKNTQNDK